MKPWKVWDELDVWTQAQLIAYNQIRSIEEMDEIALIAGARRMG
jgi:hypothetical protein